MRAADGSGLELSVIIASHNRRELLRRCLDSLAAQTADPTSFEVIVADDGSTDGTAELVGSFRAPFRLRLLRREKEGKSAALNAAIEVAAGRVCLFLDDDIVAAPELVAEHMRGQPNGRVLGIGAITELPPDARDWYAHTFAKGFEEHRAQLESRPARWTDCYGANFSAPRAALERVGGFAVGLAVAEDFDLAFRLWKAGCEPVFLPSAVGVHDDQKRCAGMLADARKQGAVHVRLWRRFPEMGDELLDWSGGAGRGELTLRRLCLALAVPARSVSWLGRFLPGDGPKMIWLHFLRRLSFWRGVRDAAAPGEWAELTGRAPAASGRALVPPLALAVVDLLEVVEATPL